MEINELYLKFLNKNIPNYILIEEVDRIYKEKYKANELDKTNFIDLKKDAYVDYANIVKCYEITDEKVLDNLYSKEEKEEHHRYAKEYAPRYPEEDHRLEEGKLINVMLESKDGKRISGYTVQGSCSYISSELVVFIGTKQEDQNLDNHRFRYYLDCLEETGYL
ncbi:hypothetical protein [Gottfriedia luciferensis]|uniref:hypothetical protein n=1 Tax=Gottfriedia luciferensis TaxID=178774 RepID=UPI000B439876|nr:hypothetical protein [Gottfriedia luciferensis]